MPSKLTEHQRRQIAERLLTGESPTTLAREYGVSRPYLSRVRALLRGRRKLRRLAPAEFDYTTARDELRRKAYVAVLAGLNDPRDSYKRASLGVQVLKGVGDLVPDTTMQVTIQMALAAVPPEWRERYTLTPQLSPGVDREPMPNTGENPTQ